MQEDNSPDKKPNIHVKRHNSRINFVVKRVDCKILNLSYFIYIRDPSMLRDWESGPFY